MYGYEVASEVPLRRLAAIPGARGQIRVERSHGRLLDRTGELTTWRDWSEGQWRGFAVARSGRALLVWCSVTGSFEIDPLAGTVRVDRAVADEPWEHRLATTAIPLLLAERGDLVLHASAIAVDGRALLFCGPSGRGKSTLALLAAASGYPVLSEDGAALELARSAAFAWPGPRGVRVAGETATVAGPDVGHPAGAGALGGQRRLLRLAPGLDAPRPVSLAAVCLLAPRGEFEVTRLSRSEAVPALVPNLLHAGDPASLRAAFRLLVGELERTPVYRVTMPDRLSRARRAARAVVAEVMA